MAPPPPGPRGEALGRLNYDSWRADMFGFLTALAETYGDITGFDLGRSPCILVNGAVEVRELFFAREGCLRKPDFVKDSNRGYWGDGLTSLEGRAWQSRRQVLRPSFRSSEVAACVPIVVEYADEMLDRWAAGSDVLRELRILTARLAARFVLDADVEGYSDGTGRSAVLPLAEVYGEDYSSRPGGDPTGILIMTRPRAPRRMEAVIRVIDDRIGSRQLRRDVLSQLLSTPFQDGGRLTRDDLVGEVIQMLYAGHLTIPSTLANFWRAIAATDVAHRIEREAEQLCSTGLSDSMALPSSYCLAALKESMRLHPPAPILYREVEIPFELGGFEFARDVAVWVSPRLLHVDPRYFPEPHRFVPERFMREGFVPASRTVYLPFGAGPRACIGSQLATLEMTLVALRAARRFTAEWISDRLAKSGGDAGT